MRQAEKHERIEVMLPDGTKMISSHVGQLRIGPKGARQAHIFKTLWGSLLSIGTFCDHGCTAQFTAQKVKIFDAKNVLILEGSRSPLSHNLWMIDLMSTSIQASADNAKHVKQHLTASVTQTFSIQKRIMWMHRTWGSPAASTFIQALYKGWIHLPGIAPRTVKKYAAILHSSESAAGHLDQSRMNAQSTTKKYSLRQRVHSAEMEKTPTHVWSQVEERNHMDITGRFPVTSRRGKQYLL